MVKDDAEIALLARACAITGAAFDEVAARIVAGMTERELAVRMERAMVDAGRRQARLRHDRRQRPQRGHPAPLADRPRLRRR